MRFRDSAHVSLAGARARRSRKLRAVAEAHARRRALIALATAAALIALAIAAVGVFAAVQILREKTAPQAAQTPAPVEISSGRIGSLANYNPYAD